MVRYQHDTFKGRSVAVFPTGTKVTVRATRARNYPGLASSAPSTVAAYQLIAGRLAGRASRVVDLGCGAGEGTAVLTASGYEVLGIDEALDAIQFAQSLAAGSGAVFTRGDVTDAEFTAFDALVAVDLFGLVANDAAMLRTIAKRSRAGQVLIGAVARADVCRTIEAPCRRNYSPEQLDALLVRAGWTAPVIVATTDELLIFECARAASLEVSAVLHAAETSDDDSTLERLAATARRFESAAEAREILLALGGALLARGDIAAAEEAFTSANAVAPNCARPIVALARAARERNADDDAEALCDHAVGLDATDIEAWTLLAEIFVARGELERGADALECAATLAPSDVELASRLSSLLADAGDVEGAARALERPLSFGGSDKMHAAYGWLAASAQRGAALSSRIKTGRHARVEQESAAQVLAS